MKLAQQLKLIALTLISITLLAACSSDKEQGQSASAEEPTKSNSNSTQDSPVVTEVSVNAPRKEVAYLTQQQAEKRSNRVSDVTYQLGFELTGEKDFKGQTTINFDLSDADSPLTIDLNKATIDSLIVNGKKVEANYNQWFITLPKDTLLAGQNRVKIDYTRLHSTNGEGLHRFVDSVDGRVYLFSHFEPAAANQMFALFDQPDLKATYELTVIAPADWTVITATRETSITKTGESNIWKF
ncbi:MAG: hypothetical protein L3J46_11175, partial [Kangiellaceae bacterium]|nr:hypothetical protein [Kangiellaceae bacterium]